MLPEILKTSIQLAAKKGDNGVGSAQGPMHAGAFEASADGHLAASFDHAGGDAQTLGAELRVAHAEAVGLGVLKSPAGVFTGRGMAADRGQQSTEEAPVEFLVSVFCLGGGTRVGGAIKIFGEVAEILLGMEAIDDLPGLRKQFIGDVPNPRGPISNVLTYPA